MPNDMDDLVSQDAEKMKNAVRDYRNGGSSWSWWSLIEGALWSFSALAVLGMVVSIPWVGDGKPIPGTTWIGLSVGSIVLFGVFAGIIRYFRTQASMGGLDAGTYPHSGGRGGGKR
jgi:hypothetical protein